MLDSSLRDLLGSPRKPYAVLDTNLPIVQISGELGPGALSAFGRIRTDFELRDMLLLLQLLKQFRQCRTTAYVLAEASNLANGLSGQLRTLWFQQLAAFAVVTEEEHVPTKLVGSQQELVPFDIADAALSYLSRDHTVITSDGRLSAHLERMGRSVINFNHLRPLWMEANG